MNISNFSARTQNDVLQLADHSDELILIVNTASKCMFTPQYAELEALHQNYAGDGLLVLAFPCNQFGNQDPGTNSEIQDFCQINYGVTFPVMAKVDVNGPNADPLFDWLKTQAPAPDGNSDIVWNFTKFLVSTDGKSVKRFAPKTPPKDLQALVEQDLPERQTTN